MPNIQTANIHLFRDYLKRYSGRHRYYPFLEYHSLDVVKIVDEEFRGRVLDTGDYTLANGGGASAASPVIQAGVVNGIARFVTGTANDATASSELAVGLQMQGDRSSVMVARVAVNDITTVKMEIGFTDALADAGAVATKATPTFNATDCALWVFDTSDNALWEGIAANNGNTSPATTVEAAIAPVNTIYEYMMVELRRYDTSNNLCSVRYRRFNADGGLTFTSDWQTNGPNSNVLLTPWLYVEARSANSRSFDVDYVGAWQHRTIQT